MRQRIVIELEGEESFIKKMTEMLRKTVIKEAIDYDMAGLRGFSIFSKVLPEEAPEEIQVPDFINRVCSSIRQSDREAESGKEALQDG